MGAQLAFLDVRFDAKFRCFGPYHVRPCNQVRVKVIKMETKKQTIKPFIIKTVVFFVLFSAFLYAGLIMVDRFIDKELNKIEGKANDIILSENMFRCELQYKDVMYKGLCTDDVLEGFTNLGEIDKTLDIIKVCGSMPYAYRLELCKKYN